MYMPSHALSRPLTVFGRRHDPPGLRVGAPAKEQLTLPKPITWLLIKLGAVTLIADKLRPDYTFPERVTSNGPAIRASQRQ